MKNTFAELLSEVISNSEISKNEMIRECDIDRLSVMLPVTSVFSVTYLLFFLSTQPYTCFLFGASGSWPTFSPNRRVRASALRPLGLS